ncbi:MAG: class I tRNA ligase family protein, partial [Actinobacteria bacterium]|nr:class I tRNA ligase family protein [Actinomycetota bacterium]
IALHGLVRDKYGKKMSKSRGNTIDPIEFMDKYGSDALRFSLARGANPGADMALAEEWIAGSRNFTTKLWNATRFAMMNGATVDGPLPTDLQTPEQWILTRLSEVISQSDAYLEKFEFAKSCDVIYHFAWDDFCDWYLEMTKHSLATATEAEAAKVRRVVGHVIDQLLRLLHPVIPFITEELWVGLTGGESLVIAEWPVVGSAYPNSLAPIAHLQELVGEIRRFRSDQGLQPARRIPAKITGLGDLAHLEGEIRSLTRLTLPEEGFASSADLQVGTTRVDIDLSGTIDVAAERTRLEKDLAAVVKEIEDSSTRLGNSDFVGKAPAAVVEKIQKRLVDATSDRDRIQDQLSRLGK